MKLSFLQSKQGHITAGFGVGGGGPQGKVRLWKWLSWFRNQHGSQHWAKTPALLLKSTEIPKGITFKGKLKSTEHLQVCLVTFGNHQLIDLSSERSHHLSSHPSHSGQHIQVVLGVVEDSRVQLFLPALPDRVRDNSTQVSWQNTGHLRWDPRKSTRASYWTDPPCASFFLLSSPVLTMVTLANPKEKAQLGTGCGFTCPDRQDAAQCQQCHTVLILEMFLDCGGQEPSLKNSQTSTAVRSSVKYN